MLTIVDEESYITNNKLKKTSTNYGLKYSFNYPCSSYSNCNPYEITFPPGVYLLDLYGASGSTIICSNRRVPGGYGGHSRGVYITKKKSTLFLYIGGTKDLNEGQEILSNSFNGGFKGGANEYDGIGGGATDFREKGGSWHTNLETRIIVAAGGGSGRSTDGGQELNLKGGNGGGTTGEPGKGLQCSSAYGTQTESYMASCNANLQYIDKGGFGYGGSGSWAGGGSGYFGGGLVEGGSGGGGSGYIGGVQSYGTFTALTEASSHTGLGFAEVTILHSFLNTFFHKIFKIIPECCLCIFIFYS